MRKILTLIVNHPVWSVCLLLIVIGLLLSKITALEINPNLEQLMPEGDPETVYYNQFFKETFGSDILSIVAVKAKGGDVFTEEILTAIADLTDELNEIDGVTNVQSLTTVSIVKGEGDYLNTEMLIDDIPAEPDALQRIRENALGNENFVGYLVSKDGKTAAININTEKPVEDKTFDEKFIAEVTAIIEAYKGNYEIYQLGSPLTKSKFISLIEKDMATVNPAAGFLLFLLLFLAYRSYIAILLPMFTAGLSVMATIGFMSLLGFPITILTSLVPSMLLVIGSTEDMHMLSLYFHQLKEGESKQEAVMQTMIKSFLPISLTSLTTIIGFGTLSISDTSIIREFGIVMAFGLFINYIVTLVVLPATLLFFKVPKVTQSAKDSEAKKGGRLNVLFDRIIALNNNHPLAIAIVTGLVVIVAVLGLFRVEVNSDYMDFFKKDTDIRKNINRFNNEMSGMNSINIVVETEDEGDIIEPEVLKKIDGLQQFIKGLGRIDKTVSLADYVKLMNQEMNGGKKEMRVIPDSKEAVAEYMLFMEDDTLSQYVDAEKKNARILVMHKISGSHAFNKMRDKIRDYIDENIRVYAGDGAVKDITVTFTGGAYLINNSSDSLVTGQVQSLGIALFAIFIVMVIVFLSIKGGLIAIISNAIPILVTFGVMGWFRIPLNVSTSLVGAIALGIAIDDTVHFMIRYQRELRATNDQKQAMANSIRSEGEPVLFTSIALALCFATFMLSNFVPTVYFAFLASMVMIYALLTDLLINPVILLAVQLITVWDYVALKFTKAVLQKSLIFKNLSVSEAKKVVLLGSIREAAAKETIVQQGESGEEMYLILSGKVKIVAQCDDGTEKELDTMEPGELFGEMALLGEGIRTATVIAETDLELLRIDYKALERVRRRDPKISAKLSMNIARILSERVQEMTLEQLREAAAVS